ncbi:sugar phosphate isomerase/epimerase [Candidatus Bathyarchaeota archaeon]|nr:sugar phosphate isomerase/epimerase [Candidatus Bathyarchaeota archaeon]
MKLSLSNGIFSEYSLADNIAAVRRLGFENLEFNMKCVEEEDEEAVYPAKKHIESHGLNCLTLHSATLPVKNENEIAKALYYVKVSADFAHKLLAPVMVVHSNVSRELPENLRRKFLGQIFDELTPYAKRLGLKLALENLSHPARSFGKSTAEIDEILSIIGGDMGVTLDFCHAETTGQTLRLLEKYRDRLLNVHVSNRAHGAFVSETPQLKVFLNKLDEYGYHGPLTLELSSKCTNKEILKTKATIEKILSSKN